MDARLVERDRLYVPLRRAYRVPSIMAWLAVGLKEGVPGELSCVVCDYAGFLMLQAAASNGLLTCRQLKGQPRAEESKSQQERDLNTALGFWFGWQGRKATSAYQRVTAACVARDHHDDGRGMGLLIDLTSVSGSPFEGLVLPRTRARAFPDGPVNASFNAEVWGLACTSTEEPLECNWVADAAVAAVP